MELVQVLMIVILVLKKTKLLVYSISAKPKENHNYLKLSKKQRNFLIFLLNIRINRFHAKLWKMKF